MIVNVLYVGGALLQCAALCAGARPSIAGWGVVAVGVCQVVCWYGR